MLDRLRPKHGATRRRKRVARGPGGAGGKTAGRGTKGQGHRSAGRETPAHFEGGQMSLVRRLPKRGFYSLFRKQVRIVNVGSLAVFGEGVTVDAAALQERRLIRSGTGVVKVLGEGEAPKGLTLKVGRVSASARNKIEAAGGSIEIV